MIGWMLYAGDIKLEPNIRYNFDGSGVIVSTSILDAIVNNFSATNMRARYSIARVWYDNYECDGRICRTNSVLCIYAVPKNKADRIFNLFTERTLAEYSTKNAYETSVLNIVETGYGCPYTTATITALTKIILADDAYKKKLHSSLRLAGFASHPKYRS